MVSSTTQELSYADKLRDPRWQRKRLEILQRDGWTCQRCGTKIKTLVVHHRVYTEGKEPWEENNEHLTTLCELCHLLEKDWADTISTLIFAVKTRLWDSETFDIAAAIGCMQPDVMNNEQLRVVICLIEWICSHPEDREAALQLAMERNPDMSYASQYPQWRRVSI